MSVIKISNLSKQYRLGQVGTGALAHDINRAWHRLRGKEDPYLKIGETNDRASKGSSEYVWALRDINFEVAQGEVLGIIGRNGAGKSTLLKILSRTTAPTTGSIKVKGRIASLLEVGTGFHPELSGRDNIFLNGAILGMTKSEIKSKFDEIVDFAGVERYIDTPVKRYSSGMYVRLAFAVAAHLEPEILVVDEVLAVGDAEFQKKALGKMKSVSTDQGRTVLFVSHNMGAVQQLCTKGMLIVNGRIGEFGSVENCISSYMNFSIAQKENLENRYGTKDVEFLSFKLTNEVGNNVSEFFMGNDICLDVQIKFNKDISGVELGVNIKNPINELISHITSYDQGIILKGEKDEIKNIRITLKNILFTPTLYLLDLALMQGTDHLDMIEDAVSFSLIEGETIKRGKFPSHVKVFTHSEWEIK